MKAILLVEDDLAIREALQSILESENYEVITADHGQHALQILPQASLRPALILLDLMMPVMNGWEFLKVIKKHESYSGIPVVVFSAGAQKTDDLAQAAHVIRKPVDLERLLEVVQRHCL